MNAMDKAVTKRRLIAGGGAVCAAMLMAVPLSGYGLSTAADEWSVVEKSPDQIVQCVVAGQGAMTVQFPSSGSSPLSMDATLAPSSSEPGVSFVGNFAVRRVDSVSFNITGTGGQPSLSTRLKLVSGDYIWDRIGLNIAADGAGVASNNISFDLNDGWDTWAPGEDKAALWSNALANVETLELVVVKKGIPAAQSYTVSGFALNDSLGSNSLTPLEQALMDAFSVSSVGEVTPDQAQELAPNGNGMTLLTAILMEHSPGYFEQNFKLSAAATSGGLTVTWPCVNGQTYRVFRSTDLTAEGGGFTQAPGDSELIAQATGYGFYTDVDIVDGVQYFYKVQKVQE